MRAAKAVKKRNRSRKLKLLSLRKSAGAIGCSVRTMRRLIAAGKIRSVRISGRIKVRSDEVARIQTQGV